MRLEVIVNRQACGGKAAHRWLKFEREARAYGLDLHPHYTEYYRHATLLARQLVHQVAERLVVFGGDGTLNEVVNGLLADDWPINPGLKLVFVGAGSSCDFLKMFPEKLDPIERLTAGKSHRVDVVKLECLTEGYQPLTRYWLVNSSIGIISRSIELFNQNGLIQRWLKRRNIDAAALYAGLKNILTFPNFAAEISTDQECLSAVWKNITVFKSPFFGGGMHYGMTTHPDDGYLHLATIRSCSSGRTLLLLPALYQGSILTKAAAAYTRTRQVTINLRHSRLWIETDGEIVGVTPARYTLLPRLLPIVV